MTTSHQTLHRVVVQWLQQFNLHARNKNMYRRFTRVVRVDQQQCPLCHREFELERPLHDRHVLLHPMRSDPRTESRERQNLRPHAHTHTQRKPPRFLSATSRSM